MKLTNQAMLQLDSLINAQEWELVLDQKRIAYAAQLDSVRRAQLNEKDETLTLEMRKEQLYLDQIKQEGLEIARQKRRVWMVGSGGGVIAAFLSFLLIKK